MDKFIEFVTALNGKVNSWVWGPIMLVFLVGTGIFLTCGLKFLQISKIGFWMKNTFGTLFKKEKKKADGKSISSFQALCTALGGTVGVGNVVGVTTAIVAGGPGAVFWMWISALVGMCTKFAEVTLAIRFRERNANGDWVGGPMYYIQNGLGKKWKWLACIFAVFGALASFGIGNLTQINTIASTINTAI